MSQNNVNYADNPTGPQLMDNYLAKSQENNLTTNSGIQRPTYAKAGTFWINSSANPWILYFYNGSRDVEIGKITTGSSGAFAVTGIDDSNYVHKTGNETINGTKTFTSNIIRSSTIDQTTTSGEVEVGSISVYDKNNRVVGLYNTTRSNTTNTNRQRVTNANVSGSNWFDLRVNVNDTGKAWVSTSQGGGIVSNGSLSDISSSTTDTTIPTKGWVNNPATSTNVVHRTGNETIAGNKEFTGTLTWNGKSLITPTGSVLPFAGSTAPSGFLICDGSAVSRTTYADLFKVIGTTYGTGDGSTTFNLPNLTDKFIQGSGTAGTIKAAGLPNITGNFATIYRGNATGGTTDGAFKRASTFNGLVGAGSHADDWGATYNFNASLSSSIYGKSSTVQPPALTMLYCIKY